MNKTRIAALLAAGTAMAVAPVLASAPAQAAPRHTTLHVSAGARANRASDRSCGSAAFRSIGAAVAAARPGATIVVCAGTYHEDVAVTKALTIEGRRGATVDAAKKNNGFAITAPNVTVTGLTIRNAIGEGILSTADRTTITHNVVENNDLGGLPKNPVPNDYAECKATAAVPGDCGEGIHLMGSSHSTVADNISRHNSGGILISDEGHPASYNRIAGNTVTDNLFDCGITVVSHNPAGAKNGQPQPTVAGVHHNDIAGNVITGNGVQGAGAGVVLATALPGGAVWDNVVRDNRISGNGMAGVSVHSHVPGQFLNGNVVRDNTIGTNNLSGDDTFAPVVDDETTGVLVGTAAPLSITVTGNHISEDHVGVWITGPATVHGAKANKFTKVTVPVSTR